MTCGTREQARAGVGTGSHPRTGNPDLEGNAISSLTGKNEKLEKQKAENKHWNEMNSVKENTSGQRNGSKMAHWYKVNCRIWSESWLIFKN